MAKVNPEIVRWARETAGYTVEEAAVLLGFKNTVNLTAVEKLKKIECGEIEPSKSILNEMSTHYHRSLIVFYLNTIPKKHAEIVDFRKVSEDTSPIEKGWLDALIRDMLARQSIVKDVLTEDEDFKKLDFVGSLRVDLGVDAFSESISRKIGFSLTKFRKEKTTEEAFKYLRSCIESASIFVLVVNDLGHHKTNLRTSLFRGFTLADEFAPFLVINGNDARSALSFTLLHELVHLWIGQNSISNGNIFDKTEKFCNDVASDILLPKSELEELEESDVSNFDLLSENITKFAFKRKISSTMVAYKLFQQKRIDANLYEKLTNFYYLKWQNLKAEELEKNRDKNKGGPSYNVIKQNQAGKGLLNSVRLMLYEGSLTTDNASKVLGVSSRNVYSVLEA